MKIILAKTEKGFLPAADDDWERSKKIPMGTLVEADHNKNRNFRFLKKYWALINTVFENLPEKYSELFPDNKSLHEELKMQLGIREKRKSLSGNEYYIPGSIAFDKMSAEEFEEYYSRVLDFVCKHILPMDRADLEAEIISFF